MEPRIWLTLASFGASWPSRPGVRRRTGCRSKAKAWLETGGHYQLGHALGGVRLLPRLRLLQSPAAGIAAWLFLAGALIFSGSLYLMAFGGPRVLGAVTPIGGVLLLALGRAGLGLLRGNPLGPQA